MLECVPSANQSPVSDSSGPPRLQNDLALTSTGVGRQPLVPAAKRDRKGHRKSRQGCFSCKKRKIKCQETYPMCDNCKRLGLKCQYMQTSAVVQPATTQIELKPSLNNTPEFSLMDFQLFHHYLVAAYPHFPVASEDIWLNYITPISHQSSFLMHALLGLSASHLSKLSPTSYTSAAQSHRLKASQGLNLALSAPLKTIEEADAVVAACNALLMQSWYMDDGLHAFLVLTRSSHLVADEVRRQNIQALLAKSDLDTFVEVMSMRLNGRKAPAFDKAFIEDAVGSLEEVSGLCSEEYQGGFRECLLSNFCALENTSIEAYQAHANVCKFIVSIASKNFISLCDPTNTVCQILNAHLVALHLVMRPISCQERKKYTVTMYRIRMSNWIEEIVKGVDGGFERYLEWPRKVGELHARGELDGYILRRG